MKYEASRCASERIRYRDQTSASLLINLTFKYSIKLSEYNQKKKQNLMNDDQFLQTVIGPFTGVTLSVKGTAVVPQKHLPKPPRRKLHHLNYSATEQKTDDIFRYCVSASNI